MTDAAGFPRWNSTVTSVEGEIAEGRTLKLKVPTAPGRVFKPKVSNVKPERTMTWSDGMAPMFKGVRTFTLTPNGDGSTKDPAYFVLVEFEQGRVKFIRDFRYVPYIASEAEFEIVEG